MKIVLIIRVSAPASGTIWLRASLLWMDLTPDNAEYLIAESESSRSRRPFIGGSTDHLTFQRKYN